MVGGFLEENDNIARGTLYIQVCHLATLAYRREHLNRHSLIVQFDEIIKTMTVKIIFLTTMKLLRYNFNVRYSENSGYLIAKEDSLASVINRNMRSI